MLDLKFIRQNAELIQEHLAHKGIEGAADLVQKVIELDAARRESLVQSETLKKERNGLSKQISQLMGRRALLIANEEEEVVIFNDFRAEEMKIESAKIGEKITDLEAKEREIEVQLDALLLEIPNIHAPEAPIGATEDENVEVRRVGTPREFDFEPLPHYEIGEKLGILDFERAAKISGARFSVLKGAGARMERALISFMLDIHTQNHGYEEILPPVLVRSSAMTGAGILPKFAEDAYKVENQDLWLIPTAEVPVTAFHADEILEAAQLPVKYVAYSACFRSEAGSAGRDTRGLIRVHQFDKVELVWLTAPDKSYEALEQLRADAEKILELLELPFRTVEHCTGDLGFKATKSYDPEVWFPSQNTYREISSCSNFEAFQARRSNIRFRPQIEGAKAGKPEFVHTLNGSGLAIGRTLAALLENNQNADGSVSIPKVLQPYLGGLELIAAP